MKPFNNIINSIVVVAMMATITTACTHESGLVNDPGLCLVTNIDVALDAGTNPTRASGDNGAAVIAFAAGDVINIGSTTMKASYKTDGSLEWKMQGNLYIDSQAEQTVSASYTPAADVRKAKADGHSIYYDHLTATASKAAGTITVDEANNTATITLNFKHVNSVATVTTVTDADKKAIAADLITAIDLILTEGGVERKVAIAAVGSEAIMPAGAMLTAVEITPRYQTPIAAKLATPYTVKANKRCPLNVTLTGQNTATVGIAEESITPWMPEDVKIPEGYDYAIATPTDLMNLASTVNAGNTLAGKKIIQLLDIDMAGIDWNPIGATAQTPFAGVYNGNGYNITALKTAKVNYGGLFGYIKGPDDDHAIVVNTHLRSCNISGITTGALAGYIEKSVVTACSSTGVVEGTDFAGGLIGIGSDSIYVTRSRSSCAVTGSGTAGGLIAENFYYISSCTASGRVVGKNHAGGFVGFNHRLIQMCYATGGAHSTNVVDGMVGGMAGRSDASINNCYSTGQVTGGKYCGTFTGYTATSYFMNCCAPNGVMVGHGKSNGITTLAPGGVVRTPINTTNIIIRTVCSSANGQDIWLEVRDFLPAQTWTDDDYPTLNFDYEGTKK
ncbi:hypothetical protein LJC05_01845 [Bacteroides sp. OttesenSCG-928-J23]|nr:hypothetical protein [Bacteroides sp. OttesenSCG-928-J23]MDL2299621.1 hypothetical protein [Bacteroides sp. OttesenSCG-928-E20]MDL2305940.1 hypothetical protein [Bacteroides sp. OttesenSCG-928-D19]